jgi:hypothetical protein
MKRLAARDGRQRMRGAVFLRTAIETLLPDRRAGREPLPVNDRRDSVNALAAPRHTWMRHALLETLLLGAVASFMLLWFAAQSRWAPYALPVLNMLPLVLGLRYGFVAGLATGALAAASLALVAVLRPDQTFATAQAQAIGLALMGMIAGQASEIWASRNRRFDALARYRLDRLEQFTSAYHLLKVSHAQLEQRVAGGGINLRNALERLKQCAPQLQGRASEPLAGLADDLLHILVEQGDLYTAAVYGVSERHLLRLPALAQAGDAPELSVFNPMLREALRTGKVTSVKTDAAQDQLIAVVPLMDASGHVHGVVAIHDMPFLAANPDTFGVLGVLGRHMGDILASRTRPVDDTDSLASLRANIQRHLVDAREHGVPCALLAFRLAPSSWREKLVAHCSRSGRGLDKSWLTRDRQGHPVVFRLLPLTDERGAQTFMKRLQMERIGPRPAHSGMASYLWMLDQYRDADEMVAEVGWSCGVDNLGLLTQPDLSGLQSGLRT